MGSNAHFSRVAKPLAFFVAGAFLLGCVRAYGGEKIELDKTPKLNFGKERRIEEISPSFKVEVSRPEVTTDTIMTPPNKPSSRATERALQEMIDRKQNWLFYGPNDSSDAKDAFLKKSKMESDFDSQVFRPKSEQFMFGEDDSKKRGKSNDNESRTDDSRNERTNPGDKRDLERSNPFARPSLEGEENQVIQELNIRSLLQGTPMEEGLKPPGFMEKNPYAFKGAEIERFGTSANESVINKDAEKRRAAFDSMIGTTGAMPGMKPADPLAAFGNDPTRQEVNPIAPNRYDTPGESKTSPDFGRMSPGSAAAIPRPDTLESFAAKAPKAPAFGQATIVPIPQQSPVNQPAAFNLPIPKRKF